MLKLVASLSRPGGGGRHLRLCHYSTNVPTPAATTFWHQRIPLQNLAETSKSRVLMTNDFTRVHLPWKPSSSRSVCPRGFTSDASATQSGFIAWYLRMLDKYTFPTKSITAANILAFADITAQYLANETLKEGETKQDWDKIRTLRMLGIGAFFTAPILHIWFNLMLWRFPKTDVASSMKKVLAGQLIASPVVNSSFFAVNSFLQGESGEQAIEKIKRDLWPTWKSGAMYWPILDFVTFRYIPIHLQVLFNNCCSFVWTIYLTSMAGKKAEAFSAANPNPNLAHSKT
ncbi:uncharacterized protein [Physcomitrium patens]|uniref:Uncharacterized protein n=1 Tax=Physcomitrium patens TaxID=3218 RepID=A0A7I4AYX3_PHYPA|nr:PXMP2/4 family protein 4-like isoform X1 [Physcomitrium patens]|eukprot:XP_024396715.1 PXMP2/4 family protein 4-like isoform X1 [Physcomitrella patens]